MRVDVTAYGVVPAAERIEETGKRAIDAKPIFNALADDLVELEQQLFHAEPWVELTPSTIARKLRQGVRPEVLQQSGDLMRSLTAKRAKNQKLRIGKVAMTFGTKLWYAKFTAGTKHEPERRVTFVSERDIREFTDRISHFLITGEAR